MKQESSWMWWLLGGMAAFGGLVWLLLAAMTNKKRAGAYTDQNGYARRSTDDKFVHRVEAERKLGRKLRSGEVVHHRNRDKRDNRRENLWVFPSQAAHDAVHRRDLAQTGAW